MLYFEQKWLHKFKESIPKRDVLKKRDRFLRKNDLKDIKKALEIKWPPKSKLI